MENEREEQAAASRQSTLGGILLLYFMPVVGLSVYFYYSHDRWSFFSLGLLMASFGTFIFFRLLKKLEESYQSLPTLAPEPDERVPEAQPPPADYTPYLEQIRQLEESQANWINQTDKLTDSLQKTAEEKNAALLQLSALQQELHHSRQQAQGHMEELREIIKGQQDSIVELREGLDRKQQQVQHFESKVRDLNYEIKTLLQLSEKMEKETEPQTQSKPFTSGSPQEDSEVQTPEEALMQLKRCVDMAQRIAGNTPFTYSYRFKDMSLDNVSLDLRHLYDRLREVNTSTVFVFAPKEDKMLFVNDQVNQLLGITSDKFIQSFNELLQEGQGEWKTALNQLSFRNDAKVQLSLKSKTGQEIPVQGLIGSIPTGIFRQYIIGVLYPLR